MNYKYTGPERDTVTDLDLGLPNCMPANRKKVQDWVAAGNTIAEPDTPTQPTKKELRRREYAKHARRDDFIELLFAIVYRLANGQQPVAADLTAINNFKAIKDQIDASIP